MVVTATGLTGAFVVDAFRLGERLAVGFGDLDLVDLVLVLIIGTYSVIFKKSQVPKNRDPSPHHSP